MAGVDRLRLTAPLAVQDLLAAARFAVQPLDDLNLASLLVSPLFGWSQDRAVTRSPPAAKARSGRSAARRRAGRDDAKGSASLLAMADFDDAARFLRGDPVRARSTAAASCSTGSARRRAIRSRNCSPPRSISRAATPRCSAFLDWFARGDVEIVRDPSRAARRGAGDDRAWREGTAGAGGDPRRRLRRSRPRAARASGSPRCRCRMSRSQAMPVFRPRKEELAEPLSARSSPSRTRATGRSIGGCSTSR